jgi:hypothetical protein
VYYEETHVGKYFYLRIEEDNYGCTWIDIRAQDKENEMKIDPHG